MIQQFLSRYHPRSVRSLVYMLQASEYNVADYFDWLGRVQDFRKVEVRKKLIKTPKTLALLTISWAFVVFILITLTTFVAFGDHPARVPLAIALFLLTPFVLAYGITIPLFALKVAQAPIEFFALRQTKLTLAKHPGIKIGIAGSFGKTSMREILKTVLAQGRKVAAPPHSHNTPWGIHQFVKTLKGDEEILIFELGEYYPGDVKKLCQLIQPDMGVITGVNQAHLEKFKTLARTTATIFELADHLGKKPIYVNAENEPSFKAAHKSHTLYSKKGCGTWSVESASTDLAGTQFMLKSKTATIAAHSQLLGLHQVGPLAAAAEIATQLGLSPAQIKSGLALTKPFDHRLEPRPDASGVITLDDSYNGNPDGVRAVIDFLASLKGHRRFYVTPGLVEMGAQSKQVHEAIGEQLAKAGIEQIVLIKNSVTPHIEAGFHKAHGKGKVTTFDKALDAFATLPHLTLEGDVVLLQNDWPDQYA